MSVTKIRLYVFGNIQMLLRLEIFQQLKQALNKITVSLVSVSLTASVNILGYPSILIASGVFSTCGGCSWGIEAVVFCSTADVKIVDLLPVCSFKRTFRLHGLSTFSKLDQNFFGELILPFNSHYITIGNP